MKPFVLGIKEKIINKDFNENLVNDYIFPMSKSKYENYLYTSKFLIIPHESGDRLTANVFT